MSKVIQCDWLDYWFKPQTRFVRFSEALPVLQQFQDSPDVYISVMTVKDNGYELTITRKTKNERRYTSGDICNASRGGKESDGSISTPEF